MSLIIAMVEAQDLQIIGVLNIRWFHLEVAAQGFPAKMLHPHSYHRIYYKPRFQVFDYWGLFFKQRWCRSVENWKTKNEKRMSNVTNTSQVSRIRSPPDLHFSLGQNIWAYCINTKIWAKLPNKWTSYRNSHSCTISVVLAIVCTYVHRDSKWSIRW